MIDEKALEKALRAQLRLVHQVWEIIKTQDQQIQELRLEVKLIKATIGAQASELKTRPEEAVR